MLITILIAAAVFLIVWNIRRMYGFESDYKYTGSFAGKRYECAVGGLSEERHALCFMGADESGLYLLPHPKKPRWFSGYRGVFKKSLFIPWTDVAYRPGKVAEGVSLVRSVCEKSLFLHTERCWREIAQRCRPGNATLISR